MEKYRIQLDLSENMRDVVDNIANQIGATTKAEVFRRALSILALLIDRVNEGDQVEVVNKDGTKRSLLIVK